MSVLTWVVEGIRKIWVFSELSYERLHRSHMLTKPEVLRSAKLKGSREGGRADFMCIQHKPFIALHEEGTECY